MNTHILFLRGVNVSGANMVKMAEFRALLSELGYKGVETYIQSGNAVFVSPSSIEAIHQRVSEAFPARFGFAPKIMLVTAEALAAAIAGNPFAERGADPARLHAGFMDGEPDAEALVAAKVRTSEEYEIRGRVFYLFTPEGIGKSKFAEGIERTLKVAVTFRNWRTVLALGEMASGQPVEHL
jgi:uncharacterized protein (DUF1697 family)